MLFTELRFLGFFVLVFCGYWLLRSNRWRKAWLLLASYAFYAAWDWRFLSLILVSTAMDYLAGLALGRPSPPGGRKLWLLLSLGVNLSLLGFFKYFNFFISSGAAFLSFLGLPATTGTLEIVLPIGISFYTFQTLSYTIDVYRGKLEPTRSLLDFSLFVAFFPQLVAGPIVRASQFLPQLDATPKWSEVRLRYHLALFLSGYAKKACIADNIAIQIDPIFAAPTSAGEATLLLGIILYGIQLYCDFSGYSEMAIAVAGLLGYQLPLNFNYPHLASSISQYWQRWHITLSTWFRDYLYFPLGGGRCRPGRVLFNLLLVFFLCSLWHGADWKFVVWGMTYGVFLLLERRLGWAKRQGFSTPHWLLAQSVVILARIPFRAATMGDAVDYTLSLIGLNAQEITLEPLAYHWWLLPLGLFALHAVFSRRSLPDRAAQVPRPLFAFAFGIAVALVLPWVAADYQPFVYFQF